MKTRGPVKFLSIVMSCIFIISAFSVSASAKAFDTKSETSSFLSVLKYASDTVIKKAKSTYEAMCDFVEEKVGISFGDSSVIIDGEEFFFTDSSGAQISLTDYQKMMITINVINNKIYKKTSEKLKEKYDTKIVNEKLAEFSTGFVNRVNGSLPELTDITNKDEYVSENFYEGMTEFLSEPAENAVWSLGYSQKSILPANVYEKDYYLGGNSRLGVKENGVLDDIKVRVIALDDNSGRGTAVYAVVDTVGLYNNDVRVIREKLKEFAKENNIVSINVFSTHTHSSIDTQGLWTDTLSNLLQSLFVTFTGIGKIDAGADKEYMEFLTDTTAEAIKEACGDMEKGKMYFAACDYTDENNINYYDSLSKFSKTKRVCYDENGNGKYISCNETISRFTFVPDSGARPTMMLNCAIHPNELGQVFNYISGDYVYYMEEVINDAGYDFIFFLGAEASTDMFEAGASDYKHIPENDDNNIEKNKLKIYNLKSFGYELGLQALYMTKTEDEVKNDIKATELTEKYLPNMIKRNDNRQWIDGTTLVGDPYYWYEDKPVSAEEEVKPILNVKCSEFFIDITNPMIVAMGKLGLANVNVLKDDDGRYYYVSEVGYVEFGDKKIMMVPCELANDLVSGEVSYTAQYSYSHTEYPYPTFAEIAEDDDLIVFGMANDSIGYVIPDNDYLQTLLWYDPYGVAYPNLSKIGIPYTPTVNRPIWVVNGKDHYMELLSFGKHTATTLSKEFQSLVDSVK